jgi:glycosyltransferase involved in cell wall biosynthesis
MNTIDNIGNVNNEVSIWDNLNHKILVVMPTYNRSDNIEERIVMIEKQIYTNWIFLIIDDGSTQPNKTHFNKIKEKYAHNNKIIFWENEINCHIAKTLNRGIDFFLNNEQNIEFSHFTWISDDNIYSPNFLSVLEYNNTYFKYSAFYIQDNINNKWTKYTNKSIYKDHINLIDNWGSCASFMWTKDAIKSIGYYSDFLPGCEDYDYFIRTFKLNPNKCEYVIYPLMTFIIHKKSLFETDKQHIVILTKKITDYYKNNLSNEDISFEKYVNANI